MRRLIAAAAAAVTTMTTVGLFGGLAGTAHAESTCASTPEKEFPTNGFNADISAEICFSSYAGGQGGLTRYKSARATVKWSEAGSGKFENFDIGVRIEQNDTNVKTGSCDITGDGTVTYNIDDDGKGNQSWDLQGTPKI